MAAGDVDFSRVVVRGSALKHGLTVDRITTAVRACRTPLENPRAGDQLLFLGPDRHGNALEVVGVIDRNDTLVVIHAMPLRRTYRRLYMEVNGHH